MLHALQGEGVGKAYAIYPGVDWSTSRVASSDRSVYPGVDWSTSRVDSRDRQSLPPSSLGWQIISPPPSRGRSFNPPLRDRSLESPKV